MNRLRRQKLHLHVKLRINQSDFKIVPWLMFASASTCGQINDETNSFAMQLYLLHCNFCTFHIQINS